VPSLCAAHYCLPMAAHYCVLTAVLPARVCSWSWPCLLRQLACSTLLPATEPSLLCSHCRAAFNCLQLELALHGSALAVSKVFTTLLLLPGFFLCIQLPSTACSWSWPCLLRQLVCRTPLPATDFSLLFCSHCQTLLCLHLPAAGVGPACCARLTSPTWAGPHHGTGRALHVPSLCAAHYCLPITVY
jgi:hypothetical protein